MRWQPFLRARADDVPYRAGDGIRQWFQATDAAFVDVREEASEVREANGTRAGARHAPLPGQGERRGGHLAHRMGAEFRDGKIARGRTYIDPEQAVKDAQLDLHAAAFAA